MVGDLNLRSTMYSSALYILRTQYSSGHRAAPCRWKSLGEILVLYSYAKYQVPPSHAHLDLVPRGE